LLGNRQQNVDRIYPKRRESAVADIVLINPQFSMSYWGLDHALPFFGKRANMPVASLPLLAALTPEPHRVTLIDENIEPIDWNRCARADIVGVTGLSVQRFRMREILENLRPLGVFTVVGGAWVTVQEDYFGTLADVIFVGEAEETWPRFLEDWGRKAHRGRYEQAEKSDMSKVPTPRFDLLKSRHYVFGSLQFSRGCPFQCEFCDIIVTFGRRPRIKTSAQIIAELECLRRQGVPLVFIVDDNLIGNKKAIKEILRDIRAWQEANGYPMCFFTEASIDLADDPELMRLMVEINIATVFIGIETPNEAALRETKKFQNLRAGGTILEKVHRIQRAGMDVSCGMILGFDHDDAGIFDSQRRFIREARITSTMVGMLHAIPKTPLHARLAADGRLDPDDRPQFGTNVIPLRISRGDLQAGYVEVLNDLYEPDAYFDRLDALLLGERIKLGNCNCPDYWRKHPWRKLKKNVVEWIQAWGLYFRLMWSIPDRRLRQVYKKRLARFLRARPESSVYLFYVIKCAMHYHAYRMARDIKTKKAFVNSF
jgi:radical SAM superfamily enzyme YgiQ (UPF0313 family)